jgi:hypothetical protein
MDVQTIDNQYSQLQSQAQQTIGELQALATKLQAAAASGDPNAREWLLDLKSVAIAIQSEQNQVSNLLQAVHNFVDSQHQAMMQPPQQSWNQQPMPMQGGYPQQGYPQQAYSSGYPQQGGGMLGGLLNSGFGRAIMTGAGFGIGDDLINKIF